MLFRAAEDPQAAKGRWKLELLFARLSSLRRLVVCYKGQAENYLKLRTSRVRHLAKVFLLLSIWQHLARVQEPERIERLLDLAHQVERLSMLRLLILYLA